MTDKASLCGKLMGNIRIPIRNGWAVYPIRCNQLSGHDYDCSYSDDDEPFLCIVTSDQASR